MQEFKKHRSEKQSSDTQIKSGNDVLLLHRKFADSLSSHEMTHLCVLYFSSRNAVIHIGGTQFGHGHVPGQMLQLIQRFTFNPSSLITKY